MATKTERTFTARLAFLNPNADVIITVRATSKNNAIWQAAAARELMGAWAADSVITDVRPA